MADEQVEIENSILGKLKLTGPTTVLLLLLSAAGASGFGVYVLTSHEVAAKEREVTLVQVLQKSVDAQEKMVKAQREQNCLMRIRPEVRDRDTICQKLAE